MPNSALSAVSAAVSKTESATDKERIYEGNENPREVNDKKTSRGF